MKKIIIVLMSIMLIASFAIGAQKELTFQWEQDVMVTGDKWELHWASVAGGPYTLVTEIIFVAEQVVYEQMVNPDIPPGGAFFVMKKIRASDGESSEWSNEVFYELTGIPFNLKIIFGSN